MPLQALIPMRSVSVKRTERVVCFGLIRLYRIATAVVSLLKHTNTIFALECFFSISHRMRAHTPTANRCVPFQWESVTHTESDRECVSESGNDGGKKTPKTHVLTKGSLSFSCNRLADTFVYSIIGAHSRSESVVSGKWSDSIHNGRKRKRAREVSLSNTHAHKCTDVKVHNPIHFSLYTHISPCVFISID